MEFRLDPDQVDMRDTVARFFADRFPLDAVAERESGDLDRATWAQMADLGICGLLADPAKGGSGLGVLEAALVFEQVGSHLVPGPLAWTVLAAPLIDGAAAGEVVVAGCLAGEESQVEGAEDADVVVVLRPDRVVAHRRAEVDLHRLAPLDPSARVARVVPVGDGEVVGDRSAADRMRLVGTVLASAELAGVASRALDVAREHALARHQFGAPIGSFQAVKHMLADMYVDATLAQSATYAAAAVVDSPGEDDPMRAAAAAKVLATTAAVDGASTAIQVLGGMGFTWDMPPNHLLKRAWHAAHRFGAEDAHAEWIGGGLIGVAR